MSLTQLTAVILQLLPKHADERGLSQSTENAILLAGAAAIAIIIVGVITKFVNDHLSGLG